MLRRRYFPVNIAKFLKTVFFIEHLLWLLDVTYEVIFEIAFIKICSLHYLSF